MNDPRLLDLLDKYLEQMLSDEERRELEELLAASPDARRTFWEVADQHALMRELAAEEQGLDLARQETGDRTPGSDTSIVRHIQGLPRPSRVRRRLRRGDAPSPTWQILFALAAAVIFIAILAVALRPQPAPAPSEQVVREIPAAPEPPPAPQPIKREVPSRKPDAPEPTPPGKRRAPVAPPFPAAAKPQPETAPVPRPVPAPKPQPRKPAAPTIVAIAKIRQIDGSVSVQKDGRVTAAAADTWITGGERLEIIGSSRAVVEYLDGTRVVLVGEGGTATFTQRAGGGQDIRLEFGILTADVAEQKKDRPLVVTTPTAKAIVLGTRLTVVHNGSSRVEVAEGRVRLERSIDGASVNVAAGHYAVAAPRGPLKARPLPKTLAVISFTLINADTDLPIAVFEPIPDGATIDLRTLPTRNLNIRADTIPARVGCVGFYLNGRHYNTERAEPWALATSSVRKYGIWNPTPGDYTLAATPWSGPPAAGKRGGTGTQGKTHTIRFRIVDGK